MKQKIYQTPEGKILFIGVLLFLLLLLGFGYLAATDFEKAKVLVLAFFVNALGGRAAGIGVCIMNDFGATLTILYNFYVEAMIVCFTYSIFVLTANNYVQVPWIRRFMERLGKKALEQKEKIQSYGWIGIFLFVMVPLPMTGPVSGTIIGYMIKIPVARNFLASGIGTLTAIVIWFFCFDFLEHRFKVIQYIFAGIILLVILSKYKSIKNFFFGKKN